MTNNVQGSGSVHRWLTPGKPLGLIGLLGMAMMAGGIGCSDSSTAPEDQKGGSQQTDGVSVSVITSQSYTTIDAQGGEDGVADTLMFRDVLLRNTGTAVLNIHHLSSGATLYRGVDTVGSAVAERSILLNPGDSQTLRLRLTLDRPRLYDGYSLTLGCFYAVPDSPTNGYKVVALPRRAVEAPN